MKHLTLTLDPTRSRPATRDSSGNADANIVVPPRASLPEAKETKVHPKLKGGENARENARLMFVGTATVILEWEGVRIMTDPNFLHAGDHVHLGPGVTGTRLTNPAVDLHDLPRIDLVCLSHYHADHFDQHVEASLRRDLPIITTPHAKSHLASPSKEPSEIFTAVHDLDFFDECLVGIKDKKAAIKVTGMPGKHVPPGPGGVAGKLNDLLGAVPPTNGWMLQLGYTTSSPSSSPATPPSPSSDDFHPAFTIYISGDTLLVPELAEIPKRYPHVDLMLVHLGGTTIPGPSMPLVMVTMDAKQGVELVRLIGPEVVVPVHFDDYDVFLSPLSDFKTAIDQAGLSDKVVYLDRGDVYAFRVEEGGE